MSNPKKLIKLVVSNKNIPSKSVEGPSYKYYQEVPNHKESCDISTNEETISTEIMNDTVKNSILNRSPSTSDANESYIICAPVEIDPKNKRFITLSTSDMQGVSL